MTEQQQLIAMLTRAGIGHGTRQEWMDGKPNGETVIVEPESTDDDGKDWIGEFTFDTDGRLSDFATYRGDQG